ncbi:MAG: RsmE family RNA methyltransferase [Planctomycetaceae bacterium]|nr:16S rRNA (uracil(1498)-N(3))-methyltransferase [Planctomycetaceae bacterium]
MSGPAKSPRFYCPDLSGISAALPADESHHARHVLRLGAGDPVELFDGKGVVAHGRIVTLGKTSAEVAVDDLQRHVRPEPRVHVGFAVPKGKRLDWLLEKVTELGAASLQPVLFERSVAGGETLSENTRQRWLGHCIAAAKQCGLEHLPEIHQPLPALQLPRAWQGCLNVLGEIDPAAPSLREVMGAWTAGRDIGIVIGPEGDLTAAEKAALAEAGFSPARLGHTIMRVETAAIALLAGTIALCQSPSSQFNAPQAQSVGDH